MASSLKKAEPESLYRPNVEIAGTNVSPHLETITATLKKVHLISQIFSSPLFFQHFPKRTQYKKVIKR